VILGPGRRAFWYAYACLRACSHQWNHHSTWNYCESGVCGTPTLLTWRASNLFIPLQTGLLEDTSAGLRLAHHVELDAYGWPPYHDPLNGSCQSAAKGSSSCARTSHRTVSQPHRGGRGECRL